MPTTPTGYHADDPLHVILDGLYALRAQIAAGAEPWTDYDGDPDTDAKRYRAGYLAVLDIAHAGIERELSNAQGWRVTP